MLPNPLLSPAAAAAWLTPSAALALVGLAPEAAGCQLLLGQGWALEPQHLQPLQAAWPAGRPALP